MKYSPAYFEGIRERYPRVADSFDLLGAECGRAGPLDERTQLFIKLGMAIGLGSEGDTQNLAQQALDTGISPEEVRHAVLITVTTAGFPAMIVAMQWVEEIIKKRG